MINKIIKEIERTSLRRFPLFNSYEDQRYSQFENEEFETERYSFIADVECEYENQPITIGENNFVLVGIERIDITDTGDLNLTQSEIRLIENAIQNKYHENY